MVTWPAWRCACQKQPAGLFLRPHMWAYGYSAGLGFCLLGVGTRLFLRPMIRLHGCSAGLEVFLQGVAHGLFVYL